jgi:hypothetical protein
MKKAILFLSVTLCLSVFAVQSTQAQLFKKLKEKAAKALEPKKTTESQPAANNESQQTNEETPAASNKKTKVKWQPTADCNKIFTLEKGETFLYDETKVYADNGKLMTAFILMNNKYEYFLIKDGNRTGPFKEAPLKDMNIVSDKRDEEEESNNNNDDEKIEIGSSKKDPMAAQYSKTINNKLYIVFNGKNFGPYDFVAKMRVSPDKKKFWAAVVIGGTSDMVAKMGMGNSFLVNESGVKQKGGDGSSFAAKMMVSANFGAAALSILDNSAQKAITISSTGKKQEGSMMDLYGSDKGTNMSVADNGDIISVPSQSPTQLLVNGNEAAAFKVPIVNMRRLFILADYKKSVYYQKGKLYRGDGSEEALTGVTFPKFATINNQPCIYYYKIHETDNGDKDVYLCKKCL